MQSESMLSETDEAKTKADGSSTVSSENVHLMLLMTGGHQCEISLPSDAPLLRELFQALANPSKQQIATKSFQIPIDSGGSSLYIPAESLVAIATDPPVQLQDMALEIEPTQKQEQPPLKILDSHIVQFDNFLSPEDHKRFLKQVLQSAFVRNSRKLPHTSSFERSRKLLVNKVEEILPYVLSKLGIPSFPYAEIEAAMNPDNNPHHYKVDNDNGSPETATRVLSFVYYCYREPKSFTGGELLIYDSKIENNVCVTAESFKTVEPLNNSIVFFFSSYAHEVLPVNCPSKAFGNLCFKLKGWVRSN